MDRGMDSGRLKFGGELDTMVVSYLSMRSVESGLGDVMLST